MSPGQINYEAWFQAAGLRRIVPWAQLRPCGQAAWEAAAQAVQMPLLEEERQLVLMALAHLAVARPGWEPALSSIGQKMHGADLFQHFMTLAQQAQP